MESCLIGTHTTSSYIYFYTADDNDNIIGVMYTVQLDCGILTPLSTNESQ